MTYRLFLDDIRNPDWVYSEPGEWEICRDMAQAVVIMLEQGCPDLISFDHDLGEDIPTGYDLAKWLVERDLDHPGFIPDHFRFYVHSANPVGASNIQNLLNSYLFHKGMS